MRTNHLVAGTKNDTLFDALREAGKHGLPPYFGFRSLRSLKIMALIMTVFPIANTIITRAFDVYPSAPYRTFQIFLNIAFCGISLLTFFLLRSRSFSLPALANIGVVYQVLGCLYFSIIDHLEPYPENYDPRLSMSLAWMWLSLFPLMLPTSMKRVLIGGVFCALTTPAVFLFSVHVLGFHAPVFMYFHILMGSVIFTALSLIMFYSYDKVQMELSKRRRMGSYQLVEKLGEGGMGEVWIARHSMLRRPAAIKLIHPKIMESNEELDTTIRRFEREAQSTASLHSPHTIQLYDFGHMDDGTFFYVMELLEGVELKTLLNASGAIPQERVVYFLRQIAHSLVDAHGQNLIHRDIKPGNIYICKYGYEYDYVKVLDFGMVKDFDAEISLTGGGPMDLMENPMLTRAGMICGTPQFMAPEMIQGNRVDARYDIYALGCVAYNMLTGDVLFSSRGHFNVMSNHLTKTPPRLSETKVPDIHPDLERLVLACLEKNPDQRPTDMNEVLRRLESIRFESPWTPKRAESWWMLHDMDEMRVGNGSTMNSNEPTMLVKQNQHDSVIQLVEKVMDEESDVTQQDL